MMYRIFKLNILSVLFLITVLFQNSFPQNEKEAPIVEENKSDSVKIILPVSGMTCSSCGFHVNRALKKVDGILYAKANADKGNVEIIYNPDIISIESMIKTINTTGYKATFPKIKKEEKK